MTTVGSTGAMCRRTSRRRPTHGSRGSDTEPAAPQPSAQLHPGEQTGGWTGGWKTRDGPVEACFSPADMSTPGLGRRLSQAQKAGVGAAGGVLVPVVPRWMGGSQFSH